MSSCVSSGSEPLRGSVRVPGDKSISIRALILGALAVGETRIGGLLEGEDVLSVLHALRALGATIERDEAGVWHVHGVGIGGLQAPDEPLDLGNSGTGARLLMGLLATYPLEVGFAGDASLSARPMDRVLEPLARFGATAAAREGRYLPLTLKGATSPVPQTFTLEVPSAQVKSALLLAGLNAPGTTEVVEPWPTRDHTERMLAAFGTNIAIDTDQDGARHIRLSGLPELRPTDIDVPTDFSSAAFPLVAATLVPGSEIRIGAVGINPTRSGLLDALSRMGADVRLENEATVGGEPVADLVVRHAPLKGIDLEAEIAPRMIDEYPVLFAAAACAAGTSTFRGLAELRVKESDRLAVMAAALAAAGVTLQEMDDGLVIEGAGGAVEGGAQVDPALDHRIAMSMLVLGLASRRPIEVTDIAPVATSFPGFIDLMRGLGANLDAAGAGPEGSESGGETS